MTNWFQRLFGRVGAPAGASVSADIAAIYAAIDDLEGRLSAARAGYLDELDFDLAAAIAAIPTTMVGTNNAALASAWTAALATVLGNYTAVRAGYLDQLDFNLQEAIAALNTLLSDGTYGLSALETIVDDLEGRLSAARAGYLDELAAANLPTDIAAIITSQGRQLFSMDFWSDTQEEVSVTGAAGDKSLPSVTVANLPAGATIVRVTAMFKFRMVENTYAGVNKLDGAQHIQVRDDTPGTWRDAISLADDLFTLDDEAREGGDVIIGDHDIVVEVDANDGYNFQWDEAEADQTGLKFNDVQCGLRIWYSIT